MNKELAEALEVLVDTHGLAEVLAALSDVCMGKAEHLRANWQDAKAAKEYDRLSARLGPAYELAAKWSL